MTLIKDKTAEQFDAVYGTRIGGLRSLLTMFPGADLRALVLFSSTTARLGPAGQAHTRWPTRFSTRLLACKRAVLAAMPSGIAQLGPLGRRHGHAVPKEAFREGRCRPHLSRSRCRLPCSGIAPPSGMSR